MKEALSKFENEPYNQAKFIAPILPLDELEKILPYNILETFVIVRHPFERLVSAFRDKFEKHENNHFFREKFGAQMIAENREFAMEKFPHLSFDENVPIFWEFVQFIIKHHRSKFSLR